MTDVDTFWDVQALTKSLCFTPPPPFPPDWWRGLFPFPLHLREMTAFETVKTERESEKKSSMYLSYHEVK